MRHGLFRDSALAQRTGRRKASEQGHGKGGVYSRVEGIVQEPLDQKPLPVASSLWSSLVSSRTGRQHRGAKNSCSDTGSSYHMAVLVVFLNETRNRLFQATKSRVETPQLPLRSFLSTPGHPIQSATAKVPGDPEVVSVARHRRGMSATPSARDGTPPPTQQHTHSRCPWRIISLRP